ncbi:MAG: PTS sugar transporter subunit IIB [Clostridium sp.]
MLRNPATALALCNLGFHIDTINVGNISNARSETGRKKLLSFIFVEAQDVECLKALAAKGIHLDIRAVPNDKSIDAMELLKKYYQHTQNITVKKGIKKWKIYY